MTSLDEALNGTARPDGHHTAFDGDSRLNAVGINGMESIAMSVKALLKRTLRRFDLAVISYANLQKLYEASNRVGQDVRFLKSMPEDQVLLALRHMDASKSQFRQDLFVLCQLDFKRDGFFVEFGATDGVDLSNTHLLEREFGWRGIVAEPARTWHTALKANRHCTIETRCVWKESGSTLTFKEVEDRELSTISEFAGGDRHKELRTRSRSYPVSTISLVDLLNEHRAPKSIDYLSIDTEGSEYEILSAFDFDRYDIRIITCEHNFTEAREKIHALLSRHGYERRFEKISQFDDWYVRAAIAR